MRKVQTFALASLIVGISIFGLSCSSDLPTEGDWYVTEFELLPEGDPRIKEDQPFSSRVGDWARIEFRCHYEEYGWGCSPSPQQYKGQSALRVKKATLSVEAHGTCIDSLRNFSGVQLVPSACRYQLR